MASSSRDDARGALDYITSCLGGGPSHHFESVCYHSLFVFNQDGDCLAATLRPGNVHSADGWDTVLLPVIDRYRTRGQTLVVRAVARFYNGRGTAEQWIKEGKTATHWTRLSCHRFRANEVRLLLEPPPISW